MTSESARAVMPIITVDTVDSANDFYTNKLGFTRMMGIIGENGQLNMVTLALNGARLMFTRSRGKTDETQLLTGKRAVEIYLEVTDVEAYHAQLMNQRVEISDPLTLQWWGDKTFKVTDPYGYEIWFYQKLGEIKPPQGVKIISDRAPDVLVRP